MSNTYTLEIVMNDDELDEDDVADVMCAAICDALGGHVVKVSQIVGSNGGPVAFVLHESEGESL